MIIVNKDATEGDLGGSLTNNKGSGRVTRTHHLVVVHRHYLDALLAGNKRVECRFSRLQKPPFGCVNPGDLLWLKPPSRPVSAIAVVGKCRFRKLSSGGSLFESLKADLPEIAAGPEFFERVQSGVRFISLISITKIVALSPMPVCKRDRRAWIVLDQPLRPNMRIVGKSINARLFGGLRSKQKNAGRD